MNRSGRAYGADMRRHATVALTVGLLAAGCGDGATSDAQPTTPLPAPETTAEVTVDVPACQAAVAEATDSGGDAQVGTALRPAFDACTSLQDFTAALETYPDALPDQDAESFVTEQCDQDEAVADSLLCRSL